MISDSEIVATTVPNSENSVIFHGVLSDGSLGMVIDPVGAGSGGSSFGPGSSLFSVVLDSTNVVKEAVSSSEKRSVRDDYKVILRNIGIFSVLLTCISVDLRV